MPNINIISPNKNIKLSIASILNAITNYNNTLVKTNINHQKNHKTVKQREENSH